MSAARGEVRDTDETPFATILADLLARLPGAVGAVLVDEEGECVDYAGHLDPYELKVAGAYFTIVLSAAATRELPVGTLRTFHLRAAKRSFIVHTLPEKYALIVLLKHRAAFMASARAIALCERALAHEAGWRLAEEGPSWHPVRVDCVARRPVRVAAEPATGPRGHVQGSSTPRPHAVEVLGLLVLADVRERGYRVRLDTGAELTIVREAGGRWYADEGMSSATARPL
jgi:predicted regulator of Ras-like GTPase activity (Roadblock/LC7/MglB family)